MDRALDAGAIVVGKANLPEFAWSVLGTNDWYGTVHNPVRPGRTTGGSSSGNAAALAAGLCDLGIGTDTGCSIRLPSAACGIVGFKSRRGMVRSTASSRSAPRSTRSARWGAPSATSRCCGPRSPDVPFPSRGWTG